MKNRLAGCMILVLILAMMSGCAGGPYSAAVTPSLTVTGDVSQETTLTDYSSFESVTIEYNDKKISVLPLWQVIESSDPLGGDLTVYFTAPDGIVSGIAADELQEDCWLYLGEENGWQVICENHPPQSGVKHMDKIVVRAGALENEQKCLRIISGEETITLSYGQLFLEDAISRTVWENDAKKGDHTVSVNTRRQLISIETYTQELGRNPDASALGYFADGRQEEIDLGGYIEWRGNTCDYIGPDGIKRTPDLIGIWIDPPELSVTDTASDALAALEDGRVLVIELDGVGYDRMAANALGFLSDYRIDPARTVMPSVSVVALAALVTGLTPDQNGVYEEGIRQLETDDMFRTAEEMGKTCAVVEGDAQLIGMSVDQQLNPDANENGTDDEVFESAVEVISAGYDLIFVHFHGFDDVGHTYGPFSEEATGKLFELDGYVADLCAQFEGTVIVTSDHGQYNIDSDTQLGEHGEFRPLAMTIPYIIFKVADAS